jgi:Fe-S cluster assembly protein SufD
MKNFIDVAKEQKDHYVFNTPGEYIVFMHNVSGKFTFEMAHEGATLEIYGLYTGKNQDDYKVETVQHHTASGSISNLFIKGVFDDESRFDYEGLIRIEKSGQKSHAYQKNQNLILSPKVFVESNPNLEILANDVFCTHGSTTGKLNADQIFYAKSRGLSTKAARELLIQGFIDEVYEKIKAKVPSFQSS